MARVLTCPTIPPRNAAIGLICALEQRANRYNNVSSNTTFFSSSDDAAKSLANCTTALASASTYGNGNRPPFASYYTIAMTLHSLRHYF
jgi:hypothetical protein